MRPLEKPTRWAEAVVVLLLALLLGMTGLAFAQSPSGRAVVILEVRGVIDPVVAQYVKQGLETANHTDAPLVIIRLDTPGGLDTAMREIVQAILNSDVPVAVFVEPSGARAASAGVFMTMAAHVAAMAPGTNIGAAHPVALGDQGELAATLEDKLTNDAVAYLQAIAQQRGRNADWAEAAVRQSASLTAQQALGRQVVDLVADDLADLLTQLDGRKVTTRAGEVRLEWRHPPRRDRGHLSHPGLYCAGQFAGELGRCRAHRAGFFPLHPRPQSDRLCAERRGGHQLCPGLPLPL
ncbi:MAG: hypothetical protein HYR94_01170 [Chloroflexi bacterium]|nr:hypothetical protein [Chloroflexota bacterium]